MQTENSQAPSAEPVRLFSESLVEIQSLSKTFLVKRSAFGGGYDKLKAVSDVSIHIRTGEVFGLAGESGCGKSTFGRATIRLIEPDSGRVWVDDREITALSSRDLRKARRLMQMIFQDPYSSLNPKMPAGKIIEEAFIIHKLHPDKNDRRENVLQLLENVGLERDAFYRYPHEFSGGQRQRIGIARAIAVGPKFIIADEPTSALDVSVQAQIVNLLLDLKENLGMTYLIITHNLPLLEFIADRIAVMYLGRLVEEASASEIFGSPRNPYTISLLEAIPSLDPTRKTERLILSGDPPSPIHPPSGCVFHTRCPFAEEVCRKEIPEYREIAPSHHVSCHFAERFGEGREGPRKIQDENGA